LACFHNGEIGHLWTTRSDTAPQDADADEPHAQPAGPTIGCRGMSPCAVPGTKSVLLSTGGGPPRQGSDGEHPDDTSSRSSTSKAPTPPTHPPLPTRISAARLIPTWNTAVPATPPIPTRIPPTPTPPRERRETMCIAPPANSPGAPRPPTVLGPHPHTRGPHHDAPHPPPPNTPNPPLPPTPWRQAPMPHPARLVSDGGVQTWNNPARGQAQPTHPHPPRHPHPEPPTPPTHPLARAGDKSRVKMRRPPSHLHPPPRQHA